MKAILKWLGTSVAIVAAYGLSWLRGDRNPGPFPVPGRLLQEQRPTGKHFRVGDLVQVVPDGATFRVLSMIHREGSWYCVIQDIALEGGTYLTHTVKQDLLSRAE